MKTLDFEFQFVETTSDGQLIGTHATPVKRYIDNLSFKFEQAGEKCKVEVSLLCTVQLIAVVVLGVVDPDS